MKSKSKAQVRDIKAEMITLYREQGTQTKADLISAGFTEEQIATNAAAVAEALRAEEFSAAA
ncbi:hypothetical protein HFO09_23310 [Rhizobium laguerreae]|uniref:hypothetical protein n=1 Tax=Rhizobium laguerreae TaxID=1076926 RepID=UPI001C923502|nr:hypothetical protein [Rhizobium laguerreae]MBY3257086.1 hypothetical protein [Rhizobium laguerreae]MBY3282447.1 hypothetical protein [Rhizobium laguerreae]MBY3291974.1 hypothetical protein [Rhizobium laguerreae]